MSRLFPRKPANRRPRIRAPFYSSIPSFVAGAFRAFRAPIAVLTIGVGAYSYASYKIERTSIPPPTNPAAETVSAVKNATTDMIDSASGGLKSVFARVPAVKPPNIDTPQFLKDLFKK